MKNWVSEKKSNINGKWIKWNNFFCMTARFWCYTGCCICCLVKPAILSMQHKSTVELENAEMCRNMSHRFFWEKKKSITFDQNEASRSKPELSTKNHMLSTVVVVCKQIDAQMFVLLLLQAHWCFCVTLAAESQGKQTLFFLCKCWLTTVNVPLMWFALFSLLLGAAWWRIEREVLPSCKHAFFFFLNVFCIRVARANETTVPQWQDRKGW